MIFLCYILSTDNSTTKMGVNSEYISIYIKNNENHTKKSSKKSKKVLIKSVHNYNTIYTCFFYKFSISN